MSRLSRWPRRPLRVVACAAAVALITLPALAEDAKPRRNGNRADKPAATQPADARQDKQDKHDKRGDRWERGRRLMRAALLEEIDLDDQQREQVDRAFTAHHEQVREWFKQRRDQMHDLKRQMHEAHKADDKERIQALRERARELIESRPSLNDLGQRIQGALTDAQWQQFEQNRDALRKRILERMREGRWNKNGRDGAQGDKARPTTRLRAGKSTERIRSALAQLDLTDQQQRKIDALFEDRDEQMERSRQWKQENSEELKRLRSEMRDAREADDREKLQALREQHQALMKQRPTPAETLPAAIHETLTDEQWDQFRQALRRQMQNGGDKQKDNDKTDD